MLWDLFAVRSLCCEISLQWDVVAVRSLCSETSLLRDLCAVRSLCCEISLLWNFFAMRRRCCEVSLLWNFFAKRSLCCEISLLWDLFAVRFRGLPKIPNTEVKLSNLLCIWIYIILQFELSLNKPKLQPWFLHNHPNDPSQYDIPPRRPWQVLHVRCEFLGVG